MSSIQNTLIIIIVVDKNAGKILYSLALPFKLMYSTDVVFHLYVYIVYWTFSLKNLQRSRTFNYFQSEHQQWNLTVNWSNDNLQFDCLRFYSSLVVNRVFSVFFCFSLTMYKYRAFTVKRGNVCKIHTFPVSTKWWKPVFR